MALPFLGPQSPQLDHLHPDEKWRKWRREEGRKGKGVKKERREEGKKGRREEKERGKLKDLLLDHVLMLMRNLNLESGSISSGVFTR